MAIIYTSQYPPAQNDTYVKATSRVTTSYEPYFTTDPTKSLTGSYVLNSWQAVATTNQRFHIDLGSGKVIKRIYYENCHSEGDFTNKGVKNFTLWGSNTAGSFAELTYGTDTGWTQITPATFDIHVGADQVDPKHIVVTNAVAYRYYAFKFADNYENATYMSVRRIELQMSNLTTVTTQAVSNVAVTTLTGNGNIVDTGGVNATRRGFCYIEGEAGDPTTADDVAYDDGSFGTGAYTKGITGLSASTHYRVRAYAVNVGGTSYGDTVQTTTGAIPTVTTQAVTAIDETTATGNGNITSIGGENATKRGVCWNIIGSPTVADSKAEEEDNFGTGAFTASMTGLSKGDKYYVKAYAYNSGGYSYGSEVTFYTFPAVTTYAPTDIMRADPSEVTANGLIELDVVEDITRRGFKYGLTEADTWDENENGDGTYTEGAFSLTLTLLDPDTTYYIQAYAIGAWGTKKGLWVEFKTAYPYGANKVSIRSEATASDADIKAVGGIRSLEIPNHLIQNQTRADIVSAAYLLAHKDQKTKLVITRPCPAPFEIGDTVTRGAKIPYAPAATAVRSYAPAATAVIPYELAGHDMLIRKLSVSFSAGNYVSILELEA